MIDLIDLSLLIIIAEVKGFRLRHLGFLADVGADLLARPRPSIHPSIHPP